nr:hypothetical protein [Acidipropionibacterium virtanenii]
MRDDVDSHAVIFRIVPDFLSSHRAGREFEAVIELDGSDRADSVLSLGNIIGEAGCRQIDVARRAPGRECRHQHSTFEDQLVGVLRRRQSGEEPLQCKEGQVLGDIASLSPRQIPQIVVGTT